MEIIVRKATEEEKELYSKYSTWNCKVSEFNWTYNDRETCVLLEGEVRVAYGDSQSVTFADGDFVDFPKGLSCRWFVTKPVKKHYCFH
ncbi:MAG: cupin domain-containing protein [Firmicutes bacterium]|nr:cupin domain-containing protein [Bacillota bacterium]